MRTGNDGQMYVDNFNIEAIDRPIMNEVCQTGFVNALPDTDGVLRSALDGLGMGLGFTLALFLMGSVREIIGSGCFFGMKIGDLSAKPMLIFIMPAGGFFVLGCLIALVNKVAGKKPPKEISCESCPNAAMCKGQCKAEEGA
jgi:electron transport complex protein RnfE